MKKINIFKVNQLTKQKAIRSVFALHDDDELKSLETKWYKNTKSFFNLKLLPTGNY